MFQSGGAVFEVSKSDINRRNTLNFYFLDRNKGKTYTVMVT